MDDRNLVETHRDEDLVEVRRGYLTALAGVAAAARNVDGYRTDTKDFLTLQAALAALDRLS